VIKRPYFSEIGLNNKYYVLVTGGLCEEKLFSPDRAGCGCFIELYSRGFSCSLEIWRAGFVEQVLMWWWLRERV